MLMFVNVFIALCVGIFWVQFREVRKSCWTSSSRRLVLNLVSGAHLSYTAKLPRLDDRFGNSDVAVLLKVSKR